MELMFLPSRPGLFSIPLVQMRDVRKGLLVAIRQGSEYKNRAKSRGEGCEATALNSTAPRLLLLHTLPLGALRTGRRQVRGWGFKGLLCSLGTSITVEIPEIPTPVFFLG